MIDGVRDNGKVYYMISKKMITVKLNNSRFSSYDNLGFELKELKREILKQLKEKKVGKENDI